MNEESVNATTSEPSDVSEHLEKFGAPRGVAKPYASARPFLESLSGIDRLRVMRTATTVHGAYLWWKR